MSLPKAYDPQDGYMYQILYRYKSTEWEHLDYAATRSEKQYLLAEYNLAYRGTGGELKAIPLPEKYWDMEKVQADRAQKMRNKFKQQ